METNLSAPQYVKKKKSNGWAELVKSVKVSIPWFDDHEI